MFLARPGGEGHRNNTDSHPNTPEPRRLGLSRRPGGIKNDERRGRVKIQGKSTALNYTPTSGHTAKNKIPLDYQRKGPSTYLRKESKTSPGYHSNEVRPPISSGTRGKAQTHYKSKRTQQLPVKVTIQNGVSKRPGACDNTAHVGGHNGHRTGLHKHPSNPVVPVLPGVCLGANPRENRALRVHGPPIRPIPSPVVFHPSNETSTVLPDSKKDLEHRVSRRLHVHEPHRDRAPRELSGRSRFVQQALPAYKLQKICAYPISKNYIPRSKFSLGHSSILPHRDEDKEDIRLDTRSPHLEVNFKTPIRGARRIPELDMRIYSVRQAEAQANHKLDEHSLNTLVKRPSSANGLQAEKIIKNLDLQTIPPIQGKYVQALAQGRPNDRRVRGGMGRDLPPSQSRRTVVSQTAQQTEPGGNLDKLPRAISSLVVSAEVHPPPREQSNPTFNRQHLSDILYQPPRLMCPNTDGANNRAPGILCAPQDNPNTQTSPRQTKSPGGPRIEDIPSDLRVVPRCNNIPLDSEDVRSVRHRSICDKVEQQAAAIRVPLPRPRGDRCERPFPLLEQVEQDLPVSPANSNPGDLRSPRQLPGPGGINSPVLAQSPVVSTPAGEGSLSSPTARNLSPVAGDLQRESTPRVPGSFQASRVETIRLALEKAGMSEAVIMTTLNCHADSTLDRYQFIWNSFINFLNESGISENDVSPATLLNFLAARREEGDLAYGTVSTYRSALALPLEWAKEVSTRGSVQDHYLRGVFHEKPPKKAKEMPKWDLNDLLLFLDSNEFEPLRQVSFKRQTQKALILTFLASGRRCVDLLALSKSYSWNKDRSRMHIKWLEEHRPKNLKEHFSPELPSIEKLARSGRRPNSLCPVRALKIYMKAALDLTNQKGLQTDNLWIALRGKSVLKYRDVSKLLKELVVEARSFAGTTTTDGLIVSPHQMRKLCASYMIQVGSDMAQLRKRLGSKSDKVLCKNYIAEVPPLKVACVLPGGPFVPNMTN